MKKVLIVLGVLFVVMLIAANWYIKGLNNIVRMHEGTKNAWAQVDNELKRRSDLIPNLVETVRGYAKQEKDIFISVAEARSKLAGATKIQDRIQASQQMESALSRLLVVVERYPELKSNETFQRLMDNLEGTENRIAVERKRYNDAVRIFNTYIREVIGGFFARQRGLGEALPYFEITAKDKETPKVQF